MDKTEEIRTFVTFVIDAKVASGYLDICLLRIEDQEGPRTFRIQTFLSSLLGTGLPGCCYLLATCPTGME